MGYRLLADTDCRKVRRWLIIAAVCSTGFVAVALIIVDSEKISEGRLLPSNRCCSCMWLYVTIFVYLTLDVIMTLCVRSFSDLWWELSYIVPLSICLRNSH